MCRNFDAVLFVASFKVNTASKHLILFHGPVAVCLCFFFTSVIFVSSDEPVLIHVSTRIDPWDQLSNGAPDNWIARPVRDNSLQYFMATREIYR